MSSIYIYDFAYVWFERIIAEKITDPLFTAN